MGAFRTALHNCRQQIAGHGHVGLFEAVGFGARCEYYSKQDTKMTHMESGGVVILFWKVDVCDFE